MNDFESGYVERKGEGRYEGEISVERVNLSPIEAVYFKQGEETYLWLKRKPILEFDSRNMRYNKRARTPQWECFLKKQMDGDAVAYRGEFVFMHFKFSVTGVWDTVLGTDKKRRLNLFVERLPMSEQTIINSINERKRNETGRRDKE